MDGYSYAEQIKRTQCGAVDDYHYFRIGRRMRNAAFHAFTKRLWTRFSGETRSETSVIKVGLRWEPEVSHSV